jgi:hypothetical protein
MRKWFAMNVVWVWRESRTFIRYGVELDTVLRALKTALVVGTILALINHGQHLFTGQFSGSWVIPALLTYLVPFTVATYGQMQGKQQRDQKREQTQRNRAGRRKAG